LKLITNIVKTAHNGVDLKEESAGRQGVKQSKDIIFSNTRVNSQWLEPTAHNGVVAGSSPA